MSGGFIPPPPDASNSSNRPLNPSSNESNNTPLSSLTPRQESRLRQHLDERLIQLERDERKHAFGSLLLLLVRLTPLLNLILQIPPVEPWGSLRISYLLTYTGSITGYITSLPLVSLYQSNSSDSRRTNRFDTTESGRDPYEGLRDEDEEDQGMDNVELEAGQTMRRLLEFLKVVDAAWVTVLLGQAWVVSPDEGGRGQSVRIDFGSVVGATERIRLRSIIVSGREKMLAWARTYGHFSGSPLPTTTGSSSKSARDAEVNGKNGTNGTDQDQADDDDEDDEIPEEDNGPGWEWENEIVGMWNHTLEVLAKYDFPSNDTT